MRCNIESISGWGFFACLGLVGIFTPRAASPEDFFIPVQAGSTSTSITESYLSGPAAWNRVVNYNQLLQPGNLLKAPAQLINLEGKAYISSRYGDAAVQLQGEEIWREAPAGLIIQKGDTLRTGPAAGMEITMENGDRALLRELTTVEFIPLRGREKTNLLSVLRGKVISIIGRTPNRDIRYRIQTPTAVSLVRGTQFRTKVGEDRKTIFEVLEGVLDVQAGEEEFTLECDFGVIL